MKRLLCGFILFILSFAVLADTWRIEYFSSFADKHSISVEKNIKTNLYRMIYHRKKKSGIVIPMFITETSEMFTSIEGTVSILNESVALEGERIEALLSHEVGFVRNVYSYVSSPKLGTVFMNPNEIGYVTTVGRADLNKTFSVDVEKITKFDGKVSYRFIYKSFEGTGLVYDLISKETNKEYNILNSLDLYNFPVTVLLPVSGDVPAYIIINNDKIELNTVFIQ